MSTHSLCFEQEYEKYQNFLSDNFPFWIVKFSIYLNRHVFVMYSGYPLLSGAIIDMQMQASYPPGVYVKLCKHHLLIHVSYAYKATIFTINRPYLLIILLKFEKVHFFLPDNVSKN